MGRSGAEPRNEENGFAQLRMQANSRKRENSGQEMICFYFLGWVSDAELVAHIEKLKPADR